MSELISTEDQLRHQLGLLYSDVTVELRKRNRNRTGRNGLRKRRLPPVPRPAVKLPETVARIRAEIPTYALQVLGMLSLRLRELTGRDVVDLATMLAIYQFFSRQAELAQRDEAMEVDDFGFDQEWTESLLPLFEWIYHHYWRVETSGDENVPAQGRALLVSNHAGLLPWDGGKI